MPVGELDLHLLAQGRHGRLWEMLGARVGERGGVEFAVWAPNAQRVAVAGDWNAWDGLASELSPVGASGVWTGWADAAEVGQRYKFNILGADGRWQLRADPMARQCEVPPATASVICGPARHRWGDAAWMTARAQAQSRPLRIYEVHLGSWQAGRSYRELAGLLADHAEHLGFTHVEFLPIAEHPFGGSWGYQVTGYYAPTSRHGTPDDFRYLVDTMHQRGLGVILDWVPAHFPKDDWALARFDGTALYEHDDPRKGDHPDWGTHVFNYGRHEVRNFLVANARYWFEEFHVDGLRVDAVASMLYLDYSRSPGQWVPNIHGGRENLEAIEMLREVNTVVRSEHPGALLIAEESTSWPGVSHPVAHGGLGFSHKWNMGWMHDTLDYFGRDPVHRPWHHRNLSFGLLYAWSERFVLPLSHDEVVHGKGSLLGKMAGDQWQRFANLRAMYAWMWAHPGAPLVFMGAELAPYSEWNADTSLPWDLLGWEAHRGVFELVGHLNHTAQVHGAVWERDDDPAGFQWLDADDATHSVYSFLRWGHAGRHVVACVANLTPVPRPGYRVGLPWAGSWEVVVDTDASAWGGSDYRRASDAAVEATPSPWQHQPASAEVDLGPLSVLWLAGRTGPSGASS
jgi:1,4-alpha-glucan branching enzyme